MSMYYRSNSFYSDISTINEKYGWWMVLRSFDLTKRSQYWNKESQEAVGGPAYEYNDIIIKARRVEATFADVMNVESRQQYTDVYRTIFYVMGPIRPKHEDILIDISPTLKHLEKPPRRIVPFALHAIERAEEKIEEELIITKCYCKKLVPINDATLIGEIPVHYKKIYNRR